MDRQSMMAIKSSLFLIAGWLMAFQADALVQLHQDSLKHAPHTPGPAAAWSQHALHSEVAQRNTDPDLAAFVVYRPPD